MATPVQTRREDAQLGALVEAYLSAAAAGRTLDRAGRRHTLAGVRSLCRALAQVEAAAVHLDAAALKVMESAALERLGRQVVDDAGLPPDRLRSMIEALRSLAAYTAAGRQSPELPPRLDPPKWVDPPAWVDPPPRATPERAPEPHPAAAPEARTPTFTMLALGAQVSAWIERIIVIAFVLTAIGLAIELA